MRNVDRSVDDRTMVISTNVSPATRSVNVLLENGTTERFALVQTSGGDVHWRHDLFGTRDGGGPEWLGHLGRLTVGDVLTRLPTCERHILAWTLEEIEAGPDEAGFDIFQRDARRRALELLSAELAGARAAA